MSASFEIQASTGPYRVQIESGGFEKYLGGNASGVAIADEFFTPAFAQMGRAAIFVRATEENKSLVACPALIEKLRKAGANRQTELVAVGGGIVQDLSAFVASVYMRGLAWTFVPTTVLSMVDSCIGGKSSINVGPYKNLVGTFHPPRKVLVDPALARTLPDDQKIGGLIEAAKICFCRGPESFERHMTFGPSVAMSTERLEWLIVNSLTAKKWFIETDEFDQKERLLLNFGHTFGHAIEGASHFGISHGVAVGLGILCALAFERGHGVDYGSSRRTLVLEEHLDAMVREVAGVREHLSALPLDDLLERFASDKKHGADHYTVIVVTEGGEVVLRKISKRPEVLKAVRTAVEQVVERFA